MEKILDGIHALLGQYKAVGVVVILLIVGFPVLTTAFMWLERIGYFGNVYQVEHAILRQLAIDQAAMARQALVKQEEMKGELVMNRGLIQGSNYLQQRTCVNTAKDREETRKCLLQPADQPR